MSETKLPSVGRQTTKIVVKRGTTKKTQVVEEEAQDEISAVVPQAEVSDEETAELSSDDSIKPDVEIIADEDGVPEIEGSEEDLKIKTSDSRTSVTSAVTGKKEYRAISRPNVKSNNPDANDLWGLAGKWLVATMIHSILAQASTDPNNPIDSAYRSAKKNGSAYGKREILARALGLMTPRVLVFEQLKNAIDPASQRPVVSRGAKLKDFYLQFYDNGPIFPGDVLDSAELKAAAGIQLIPRSGSFHPNIGARESRVGIAGRILPSFFDERLLKALQSAAAEDESTPEITSPIRQELIRQILDTFTKMDDASLRDELKYLVKNLAKTAKH